MMRGGGRGGRGGGGSGDDHWVGREQDWRVSVEGPFASWERSEEGSGAGCFERRESSLRFILITVPSRLSAATMRSRPLADFPFLLLPVPLRTKSKVSSL